MANLVFEFFLNKFYNGFLYSVISKYVLFIYDFFASFNIKKILQQWICSHTWRIILNFSIQIVFFIFIYSFFFHFLFYFLNPIRYEQQNARICAENQVWQCAYSIIFEANRFDRRQSFICSNIFFLGLYKHSILVTRHQIKYIKRL